MFTVSGSVGFLMGSFHYTQTTNVLFLFWSVGLAGQRKDRMRFILFLVKINFIEKSSRGYERLRIFYLGLFSILVSCLYSTINSQIVEIK